jgi:hypothetical protein
VCSLRGLQPCKMVLKRGTQHGARKRCVAHCSITAMDAPVPAPDDTHGLRGTAHVYRQNMQQIRTMLDTVHRDMQQCGCQATATHPHEVLESLLVEQLGAVLQDVQHQLPRLHRPHHPQAAAGVPSAAEGVGEVGQNLRAAT